jgi:hypothetical protein
LTALKTNPKKTRGPQLALSGVWGLDRSNPVFDRWYGLMSKYGFAEGKRRPL